MDEETMYRAQILELYKNPLNKGNMSNPTKSYEEFNQLCGDKIKLELKLDEGNIIDAKFNGSGCAISIASASLLTDEIKGRKLEEVKNMGLKDIEEIMGFKISPGRVKCASLALEALKRI